MVVAIVAALAGCSESSRPAASAKTASQSARPDGPDVDKFLDVHWARPLAPQGRPPTGFTATDISLDPESCGSCHADQFDAWRGSLHAAAMSPGLLGQLAEMDAGARDEHQECIRCHAPLAEQADSLAAALATGRDLAESPPGKSQPLHRHGMSCAACHVRGHERYGPPRRDGSAPRDRAGLPHGGWTASRAFEDSRFCAACHQFQPDQYALNGKLIENTYEEWKASRHAREGKTCQSCHMPDRRHLWRGIHDPETTRAGITIDAVGPTTDSGRILAALSIRNSGTGHHFPTYVTPKVIVEGVQESARGKTLPGTLQQLFIERRVKPDLSAELSDSRLAPDQSVTFNYRAAPATGARTLVLRVRVEPDAFYTGLYRELLASGSARKGRRLIQKALENSIASQYTLFESRFSMPLP
ncbi:MAG: multiheme c-type cytochrome [Burkholderiales bacterium]